MTLSSPTENQLKCLSLARLKVSQKSPVSSSDGLVKCSGLGITICQAPSGFPQAAPYTSGSRDAVVPV